MSIESEEARMLNMNLARWGGFARLALFSFAILMVFPAHSLKAEALAGPLPAAAAQNAPDPRSNPVLADIMRYGARVFYMGNLSGADSWFIYKNRQMQFAYTFRDSQNALIGVMFGPNGQGITSKQLDQLINTNPEVNLLMKTATSTLSSPEDHAAINKQVASAIVGAAGSSQAGKIPMASLEGLSSAAQPALASPGERLYADLSKASGVDLGNDSAPVVMMVMNPNCSHCKASWRSLRDSVQAGKIRVRLVPVAATPEEEALGAQLLHVADPLTVWDKFVGNALGGDKSQLAGTPDEASRKAVKDNYALADSWSIRDTPYFVYRGKNGKVKILRGEPEKVADFLGDVAAP